MNQFATPASDRIPSDVVAPILKRVIRDYGKIVSNLGSAGRDATSGSGYHGVCELVATQFGGTSNKWYKGLERILKGESETTSISFVDHFLVSLGAHHLWYVEPLSDFYFSEAILSMPEEDCGDLMFFSCCNRWGSVKQKYSPPSRKSNGRMCIACAKAKSAEQREKYKAEWRDKHGLAA